MTLEQLRNELIKRRKDAGLSQSAVAYQMEIESGPLSVYESGKRNMSYKFCERYANVLGLNLSIKLTDPKTGEVVE